MLIDVLHAAVIAIVVLLLIESANRVLLLPLEVLRTAEEGWFRFDDRSLRSMS